RHDRPEHFALHDLVGLPGTGDDGRLIEKSRPGARLAAGRDLHVRFGGRARHKSGDAFALALGYQRTHLDPGLLLPSDLDGAYRLRQVGDHALVDALADIHAAGRRTVLAGVVKSKAANARNHLSHVGVIEHDY